jgi:hypothetical protein
MSHYYFRPISLFLSRISIYPKCFMLVSGKCMYPVTNWFWLNAGLSVFVDFFSRCPRMTLCSLRNPGLLAIHNISHTICSFITTEARTVPLSIYKTSDYRLWASDQRRHLTFKTVMYYNLDDKKLNSCCHGKPYLSVLLLAEWKDCLRQNSVLLSCFSKT